MLMYSYQTSTQVRGEDRLKGVGNASMKLLRTCDDKGGSRSQDTMRSLNNPSSATCAFPVEAWIHDASTRGVFSQNYQQRPWFEATPIAWLEECATTIETTGRSVVGGEAASARKPRH